MKLSSRVAGTSAKVQGSKPMLVIVMLLIVMTECQYLGHFDVQIPRSTLIVVKQLSHILCNLIIPVETDCNELESVCGII